MELEDWFKGKYERSSAHHHRISLAQFVFQELEEPGFQCCILEWNNTGGKICFQASSYRKKTIHLAVKEVNLAYISQETPLPDSTNQEFSGWLLLFFFLNDIRWEDRFQSTTSREKTIGHHRIEPCLHFTALFLSQTAPTKKFPGFQSSAPDFLIAFLVWFPVWAASTYELRTFVLEDHAHDSRSSHCLCRGIPLRLRRHTNQPEWLNSCGYS